MRFYIQVAHQTGHAHPLVANVDEHVITAIERAVWDCELPF
jgi:hypothetical protein